MKKPYLIAEVGVNFYDTAKALGILPLEAAKIYIEKAAQCGADAVKFQSYKADKLVSKNSPAYWDLTKEPTPTQHALFRKHDGLEKNDFIKLSACCEEYNIDFISTPFDFESADYLDEIQNVYKISSSDLNNFPFIRHIAEKGKPIILSVGASYLSEVEETVRFLEENGCEDLTLLHCVLSYPTRNEDANLHMISHLKAVFPQHKIGYSDHTLPDPCMTILTTACLLGAEVIEKHFTLDKTLPGNDHYHAMDPDDLLKASANFKLLEVIGGRHLKTVIPCETVSRREARRSLVLARNMKQGEIITENDISIKRPGTGIPPSYQHIVVGRPLKVDALEDTVLVWDMLG